MTCTLWRVSESDVQRLSASSPEQIEEFLFGEVLRQSEPPKRKGLIGWLKNLSPIQVESYGDWEPPTGKGTQAKGELDLDKSWHGLHYLFTGTADNGDEPGCFLLRSGEYLGDEEIGNIIPHVLRPAQVQQFARFLSQLSEMELRTRYDPARMMKLEIYPEVWNRNGESELQYLLGAFKDLREFVGIAAVEGDAVIVLVD
jgi:hypothetical protein